MRDKKVFKLVVKCTGAEGGMFYQERGEGVPGEETV